MEQTMSGFAAWLNTVFAGLDAAAADFAFALHGSACGKFFDWFFPAVTVLGNGGLFFIFVALVALLFCRSRKTGLTILTALIFGLLLTNLFLKNAVARPRPYVDELSVFFSYWQEIGHGLENEVFSFPSGHATASFGAMTAVFWCGNKKYSWSAFLLALLIGFSRIYIFVHYASDILGGMLVGFLAGTAAYLLISWLFQRWERSDTSAAAFITNASIVTVFRKNTKS